MANLTNNQKRCEDCPNLKIIQGVWTCEECFNQHIEDIDDCPEGVTLEQIEELDKKAKENKIAHNARTENKDNKKKTEKKPKEASAEKQELFSAINQCLVEKYGENVQVSIKNKLFLVKIGDKSFKIDLIEQRTKKT